MKQFGITLVLFGIGSFVLNLMHYEFRLLMWIDQWGRGAGIAIRVGLVVLGAALFFFGLKREKEAT
ncbi:MAG: hypothetical protein J0L53_03740 [Spirochaetes bacterium]|nr:hypothetical protein [Spirochaetota bacterium]MBX3721273.1 hypothetical protein [Turneriella sp.]